MRRTPRRRVSTLVVAACGGGDDDAAADPSLETIAEPESEQDPDGDEEVVRLLGAIEHPSYLPFAPISSPDVAPFTTLEVLPATLELAPDDSVLDLGDQIALVGFPGDVDQFVFNQPGLTVPQVTSLSGSITARRSYDPTTVVAADTLDQYQHQAPTTPGTSGSAMTYCGLVVAVNNAGTVKQFVTPPRADGEPFGVLPGTDRGSIVSGELVNEIEFTVADDGSVSGSSWWPATGQFTLTGSVDADGAFRIVDDAPERVGYRRGVYEGTFDETGGFTGQYSEEGQEAARFDVAGGLAG